MTRRMTGIARACAVAALIAAAAMPSCAYLNTLYNARRIYREAEKTREAQSGAREQREKYKEVVKKCSQMIQDYPKSRWIDDAMFLMGQALVRQEEYDKAIRKFQEIITNFPKSDYVPKSIHWLALAYHLKNDETQALVHCERFIAGYPKHDLRFDALFLGGDIKRALKDYDGALDYYGIVAAEAKKKEIVEQALLKSAELFRERGEWEKAAASYRSLLRKGIPWQRRYEISLALGDCLAKTGECAEALALFDELIEKTTATLEIPPMLLGRAASYVCMDSLPQALAVYKSVETKYLKSIYSAEAYYRSGVIYQERLDSLKLAADAFAAVGGEFANSEFAAVSLERSSSIKRLLDLQKSAGSEQSAERAADKRFMAAEIQLTRLENIPLALSGYASVLDSFPETSVAPRAAYAIAWIRWNKLGEKEAAIDQYRKVVERYPRSHQAKGALQQLALAGADSLARYLHAYRDSALADTAALADTTTLADTAAIDTAAASRRAPPRKPAAIDTTASSQPTLPGSPMASDTSAVPRPATPGSPAAFDTNTVSRSAPPRMPAAIDTTAVSRSAPPVLKAAFDTLRSDSMKQRAAPAPPDTLNPMKGGGAE